MTYSQLIHLGCYGRSPRKGEPRWSCISGVTAEGARVPGACNHLRDRGEALIIFGISPIEAGRLAIERADEARDAGVRNRRLRRDGVALLAGVVSYPIPRMLVDTDPVDQDVYRLWRRQTLEWLQHGFGDHLKCVVEHADETYYHLHFYVVPALSDDRRLDIDRIHPGRYAKIVAAAEGADHKNAERSYRQGMRKWQDEFHRDVSAFFGHDRYGPRRMRVSNRQHKMEKQMAEERARQQAALDAERAAFERTQATARAELDRERARLTAAAHEDAWQAHGKAHADLRAACTVLKGRVGAERAGREAAEAELAALRVRLAALEDEARLPLVA